MMSTNLGKFLPLPHLLQIQTAQKFMRIIRLYKIHADTYTYKLSTLLIQQVLMTITSKINCEQNLI